MNSDPSDRKLQQLFDGSRAEDARRAPAFDAVASGRRTAPRTAVRWKHLAAAAAAIVVFGASLTLFHRRSAPGPFDAAHGHGPAVDYKQWTAVSDWRASTDSLLTVSDSPWSRRIIMSTDSLINSVSGETDAISDNGKEAL
jgi:hypothetical protein